MPASSQGQETAVTLMFEGTVSNKTCSLAVKDAQDFIIGEGIQTDDKNYDLFIRYYACHLLYMWNFAARATSKSVTDISTTYKDLELGDKEGMSPYLLLFQQLSPQDNKFMTDI